MSIPSPRTNLNEPRFDWWIKSVYYHSILVSISREILKKKQTKWRRKNKCIYKIYKIFAYKVIWPTIPLNWQKRRSLRYHFSPIKNQILPKNISLKRFSIQLTTIIGYDSPITLYKYSHFLLEYGCPY